MHKIDSQYNPFAKYYFAIDIRLNIHNPIFRNTYARKLGSYIRTAAFCRINPFQNC